PDNVLFVVPIEDVVAVFRRGDAKTNEVRSAEDREYEDPEDWEE
ncbi:MAG TPA: co-chaperone GroES, partial [Planctomycetaceae bacterium]|nr:co-chaperone GroES [Planctomycetaceae bacterium]